MGIIRYKNNKIARVFEYTDMKLEHTLFVSKYIKKRNFMIMDDNCMVFNECEQLFQG